MKKVRYFAYARLLRGVFLLLADWSAYLLALLFTFLILCFCGHESSSAGTLFSHFWEVPVIFFIIGVFSRLYGGNFFYGNAPIDAPEELKRITIISIACYLLVLGFSSFGGSMHSWWKIGGILTMFFVILLVTVTRYIVRTFMKRTGIGLIPVFVAGGGKSASILCAELSRDRFYGYDAIGYFDDNAANPYNLNIPRMGSLDDVLEVSKKNNVNTLICCIPINVLDAYRNAWSGHFLQFIIVPDVRVLPVNWCYALNFNSIAAISIGNQLHWKLFCAIKIFAEVLFSLMVILMLGGVFLILAILVKLTSRGPVFFVSKRLGKDGRPFNIYKFRTMYNDASEKLKELLAENPKLASEWEDKAKLDNDPRITPVGRFLRKTSLDEMPQLVNVLKGDMALIGPRPIVADELWHYGDAYKIVSRVKPGITGFWQVSGRSKTSYETRVRLDLFYVNNWSIWLDYYIFLKTIKEVLLCKGAK